MFDLHIRGQVHTSVSSDTNIWISIMFAIIAKRLTSDVLCPSTRIDSPGPPLVPTSNKPPSPHRPVLSPCISN